MTTKRYFSPPASPSKVSQFCVQRCMRHDRNSLYNHSPIMHATGRETRWPLALFASTSPTIYISLHNTTAAGVTYDTTHHNQLSSSLPLPVALVLRWLSSHRSLGDRVAAIVLLGLGWQWLRLCCVLWWLLHVDDRR